MNDQPGGSGAADGPQEHYRVIVIGAGPTGLTLANLLGRYGVQTLLVERNLTTVQEPRAVSIDDESLRTMQATGLVEEVLRGVVSGYGSQYRTPSGRCFLHVQPTAKPYGYDRRNAFRQPVIEAQLRDGLARFDCVHTRFGWQLDRLEQDPAAVRLTLRTQEGEGDGQVARVSCDYLVGADGASSLVRRQIGVSLEGETFAEKWLIVDLENSPTESRETQVFCDVARPCIALPGPGLTRRFEFKLLPGETSEEVLVPETVQKLLDDHGAAPGSIIRRKVVYTFHARLAPTWSKGRVFLAGDACHLTPPFAGQGMNSGVRDAHNLAWKLAAVCSGWIGPGLLDTYEQERRNHVGEMIQLALRMGKIMGPSSRFVGWATQTALTCLGVWPAARSFFAEMKYKPKPRFAAGFVVPDALSSRTTRVGRLLPQPDILLDGAVRKLDDLLGDGFALLGFTDEPERVIALGRSTVFERLPLARVVLSSRALSAAAGVILAAPVPDAAGDAPNPFGADLANMAVLVRPDRYVAAVFPLGNPLPVTLALEALLARCATRALASDDRAACIEPAPKELAA